MKRNFLLAGFFLILSISCKKNGGGAKPSISLKSINTVVANGGELDAIFNFNNSSSGLSGGTFTALLNDLNRDPIINPLADTIVNYVPSFPNNAIGQFEFTLTSDRMQFHVNENDTLIIRFVANDVNGNPSDTINSPVIIVQHP